VANQYTITKIDLADTDNFMASPNVFDVAIRNNLWNPNGNAPFSFAAAYAQNIDFKSYMATRRYIY
jgi:dipeptidase